MFLYRFVARYVSGLCTGRSPGIAGRLNTQALFAGQVNEGFLKAIKKIIYIMPASVCSR
jgi:hypothetical protein